jgi:hypothetical protein
VREEQTSQWHEDKQKMVGRKVDLGDK